MPKNFAAIAIASNGLQVLRYFEPDGDDLIMHNVVRGVDGTQADLTVKFPNVTDEFETRLIEVMIDGFNTEEADNAFQQFMGFIEPEAQ